MHRSEQTEHDSDRGVLAVASHLPRNRASVEELARQFGKSLESITAPLGLREKCVATEDDEHPAEMGASAASRALAAMGASGIDVGLLLFAGTSHDWGGSWSVAVDIARRIGASKALAYEIALGCAAPMVSLDLARQPTPHGKPPLAIVVVAERWSNTLAPDGDFPLAWIAHADGAAALVVGPGARMKISPAAFHVDSRYNDFLAIPGGGTREPLTHQAIDRGRQYRRVLDRGDGDIATAYVAGYEHAILGALRNASKQLSDVEHILVNQVRPGIRELLRARLGIRETRMLNTYPQLGHVGGADPFIGLERVLRHSPEFVGTIVLASSSVSTFGAAALVSRESGVRACVRPDQ